MQVLRCTIVKWLGDEPQPGWVEANLTDANGRTWLFRNKPPMFSAETVTATMKYPIAGELRCEVLHRDKKDGRELLTVRVIDVDADGKDRFVVDASDVLVVDD